jgi:hypothetical protein
MVLPDYNDVFFGHLEFTGGDQLYTRKSNKVYMRIGKNHLVIICMKLAIKVKLFTFEQSGEFSILGSSKRMRHVGISVSNSYTWHNAQFEVQPVEGATLELFSGLILHRFYRLVRHAAIDSPF